MQAGVQRGNCTYEMCSCKHSLGNCALATIQLHLQFPGFLLEWLVCVWVHVCGTFLLCACNCGPKHRVAV